MGRRIIIRLFRDKHFKNEIHSLDAYYECILSREINTIRGYWQGVEEGCKKKCMKHHLEANF